MGISYLRTSWGKRRVTRERASGLRAAAAVIMLLVMLPLSASAQWNGSGQATVDAFSCGPGRWENGVYHQDFYLKTTVQPTGDPRYNAMLTPISVNGTFYFTTANPYVQSTFDGTVTLSYSAGTGFGYGSPAPGTTVRYYISGSVIDSMTGGAVSGVSFREVRCVVASLPVPTPEPTNTPEPTPTNTPEPTPTNTPVPTPTNTPEPTPTNTPEPTPTNTPEPTPTNTPEPTPTNTPEPTPTNTPEPTPTNTPEPTPTNTPEPTATTEPSPTATTEPSPTATAEPSPTATIEPSPTSAATSEPGVTPSPTIEPTATETVVPTSTSEPGVTPTSTTVETPTVTPNLPTMTLRIAMPNGENISGVPWDLYAPVASQAAVQPYRSGIVGANNTIQLADIPYGTYQLVIRPEGRTPIEFLLTVDGTTREMVLQVPAPPVAPATGTVVPATAAPTQGTQSTATSTVAAEPTVSALPSTGAGGTSAMPMTVLIAAGCIVTIMMSAFVVRRSED